MAKQLLDQGADVDGAEKDGAGKADADDKGEDGEAANAENGVECRSRVNEESDSVRSRTNGHGLR